MTKPLLEKWKRSEAIKDHIICQNCGKVNQSLNTAGIIISLIESDLKKAIDEVFHGYFDAWNIKEELKQKIFGNAKPNSAEKELNPHGANQHREVSGDIRIIGKLKAPPPSETESDEKEAIK